MMKLMPGSQKLAYPSAAYMPNLEQMCHHSTDETEGVQGNSCPCADLHQQNIKSVPVPHQEAVTLSHNLSQKTPHHDMAR